MKETGLAKIEKFTAVEKAVAQLENAQAAPFSDTMSYLDLEQGETIDVVFFGTGQLASDDIQNYRKVQFLKFLEKFFARN